MTKRFPIRSLLWFDCVAAGIAGVAMFALSGLLAPLFGIPRAVLTAMALVNLAYGAFSYSLARQPEAPRRRVRALVVANYVWTGVCVGLAALFAGPESWLGAGYILAEGLFVGALATVEAWAYKDRLRAALLASAVVGLALHGAPARADAPSDLTPLLHSCRTFVTMDAQLAYRPGREAETRPLLLTAQSSWLLADVLWGTRAHYAFKDGLLTVDSRSESTPPSPPGGIAASVVGDLFAACRTGFPGTQWVERRPEDDGFWFTLANVTWYKADLPYAWANDVHLYVAVHTTTRRLTDLTWRVGTSEDWSRIRVDTLNWAAESPPPFSRNAPSSDLPRPATFERMK